MITIYIYTSIRDCTIVPIPKGNKIKGIANAINSETIKCANNPTLLSWRSMVNDVESYISSARQVSRVIDQSEEANLPRKCRHNFKIQAVISCTTENVLPKVRNHGRYVQEVSRKRREYLSPAMLAQQDLKTLSSNLLVCFFLAVLVLYMYCNRVLFTAQVEHQLHYCILLSYCFVLLK